ncbi:hypothetical protein GCM10018789_12020 [Streptomyces werraensis]|nr:hypothetical protein GCM10018789_12020 [Streptomyces werraensis]
MSEIHPLKQPFHGTGRGGPLGVEGGGAPVGDAARAPAVAGVTVTEPFEGRAQGVVDGRHMGRAAARGERQDGLAGRRVRGSRSSSGFRLFGALEAEE